MSNAQEINQKVQDQTLEAVGKVQDAAVEAVTSWTENANKLLSQLPDITKNYDIPGFAEFTKQFPTIAELIDANFEFAQRLLTSQRDFAQRIAAAATPAEK